MCGIVGAVAARDVVQVLLEGLRRLEYRGYDSAGIATHSGQCLNLCKAQGKVAVLESALTATPQQGQVGIGHTRWATHGKPSTSNAHPHMIGERIAVVHNGIIENYQELAAELRAQGYSFVSQTDTEVAAALIDALYTQSGDLLQAVQTAVQRFRGAYALAVLAHDRPDELVAVRLTSPLLIGVGIGEHFLASDMSALVPVTQQYIVLEPGDVAHLHRESCEIYDAAGAPAQRAVRTSELSGDAVSLQGHTHYMHKEMVEQPSAVRRSLQHLYGDQALQFDRPLGFALREVNAVHIVACGTAFYAGLTAKYWFEQFAGVPCQVEIASEFRYRDVVAAPGTLYLTISQSGETVDTLAALQHASHSHWLARVAVCNVPESSLVRDADAALMTQAGIEVGVASTKAFTTQLVALHALATEIGRAKSWLVDTALSEPLQQVPELMEQVLQLEAQIKAVLVAPCAAREHAIFLGRGTFYPIALEGALKLKEISYIHAEGYPGGELKHGPLALVDEHMPVIAVVPNDSLSDKMLANLEEVRARGGQLLMLVEEGVQVSVSERDRVLTLPRCPASVAPIVYVVALQLLAYHVALAKGTDVDKPRNLAKSVTVE